METQRREEIQEVEHNLAAAAKSRFRRICVFCGSSSGKNPSYQIAAIQLGKQLVLNFLFSFSSKFSKKQKENGDEIGDWPVTFSSNHISMNKTTVPKNRKFDSESRSNKIVRKEKQRENSDGVL